MVVLLINILALWFSFVGGILLGALFYKPLRQAIQEKCLLWFVGIYGLLRSRKKNPIIKPSGKPCEAEAVFNPAAVILGGRTHLIYRAIGSDGISRRLHK